MTKQIKISTISFVVLMLAAGGYFAYIKYFSKKYQKLTNYENQSPDSNSKNSNSQPKTGLLPAVFPGFKLYKNSDFGFEIQYPELWTVGVENIVNVRGENTKGFFFKKPGSDLRFAVLPKDGLSYGLPSEGTSENINIDGYTGVQTKYIMPDGRRLLLVHPQVSIFNWDREIGRIDIESSVADPIGDFSIFNKMLNSFKFIK